MMKKTIKNPPNAPGDKNLSETRQYILSTGKRCCRRDTLSSTGFGAGNKHFVESYISHMIIHTTILSFVSVHDRNLSTQSLLFRT